MSITLRRPMFRGGKINAYGTGITANLEPRKKYAGEEQDLQAIQRAYAREIARDVEARSMPSYGEQVADFLSAFGASAAPAGQYQTIGSALGQTGINFQNIFGAKEQAARKAGSQAYLSALEGLSKEKLIEYEKLARDAYETGLYPTEEAALAAVVKMKISGKDTKEKEDTSYKRQLILQKTAEGKDLLTATVETNAQLKIINDPNLQAAVGNKFKGVIPQGFQIDPDSGNFVWSQEDRNPPGNIRVNAVYVDPASEDLFYFDGAKTLIKIQ